MSRPPPSGHNQWGLANRNCLPVVYASARLLVTYSLSSPTHIQLQIDLACSWVRCAYSDSCVFLEYRSIGYNTRAEDSLLRDLLCQLTPQRRRWSPGRRQKILKLNNIMEGSAAVTYSNMRKKPCKWTTTSWVCAFYARWVVGGKNFPIQLFQILAELQVTVFVYLYLDCGPNKEVKPYALNLRRGLKSVLGVFRSDNN